MLPAGVGSHVAAWHSPTCGLLPHCNRRRKTAILAFPQLQVAAACTKICMCRVHAAYATPSSTARDGSCSQTHASVLAQAQHSPSTEEIAARIAASRERRAARAFIKCPACSIGVASPAAMHRHMRNCCADLLDDQAWHQMLSGLPDGPTAAAPLAWSPLQQLLSHAAAREQAARDAVLHATFHSGMTDAQGRPIRQSADAVAAQLSLPTPRVSRLLSAAMRAVPLVADTDPVHILHECEHFLAVNKPPGVQTAPVHRFKGGSMVNRVLHHLKASPHVLHRLDMDTSGVLLFAKTPAVTSAVHKQFRARQVAKMYVCVSQGVPPSQQWEEHGMIGRHPTMTVARRVRSLQAHDMGQPPAASCSSVNSLGDVSHEEDDDIVEEAQWQQAHTSFLRLVTNPTAPLSGATPGAVYEGACGPQGASLVAAAPHTGRTHQIRVHMAAMGHPLLGDELYGLQGPWIPRQALHAARLRITHPITKEPMTFSAPLPDDIMSLLHTTGLGATQAGSQGTDRVEQLIDQAWHKLHCLQKQADRLLRVQSKPSTAIS